MTMTNEDLLKELESFVEGVEDSLIILAGTLAEAAGPAKTLAVLVTGIDAIEQSRKQNAWRTRLMTSVARIVAIKAKPYSANDPALQTLISDVLGNRGDEDPIH